MIRARWWWFFSNSLAMAALSCTGLPVASSLTASHIDCTTVSSAASTSFSRAMEPCVGCMQPIRSRKAFLGLGRATGLNSDVVARRPSNHRNEDKSRLRLEVVQQAATPTLSFPERNSLKNLNSAAVSDVSGIISLKFLYFSYVNWYGSILH